jgi:osmotically-inducible protein OsmY
MAMRKPTKDETIRDEVTEALANDVRVDESGINVDVVGGTVYLTGVAPSLFQKRTAEEIVGRIRGVLDVDNELQVAPQVVRSDDEIKADVRGALARDAWIDEQRIDVVVDQGIVYLKGTVQDGKDKAAAGDDAWTVPAVLDVVNDLAVAPHVSRPDEEIATELRRDIERNVRIQPQQIHIKVRDGVVYLDGTVSAILQRWICEDVARWIPGVIDVVNHLAIEGP